MRLARLEVSGVRNLAAVAVTLSPGLNLFAGANGAGKTALLESVHVLSRGRSFRASRVDALIQHGRDAMSVRATLLDEIRGTVELAMRRDRSGVTALQLNERPERRLSEAARLLPIQVFLPEESELVFGGPSGRRQFLDWGVFHVKPSYLADLQDYQRSLRQRNHVLHAARAAPRETARPQQVELRVWTSQLCESARLVDAARTEYLDAFAPVLRDAIARLGSGSLDVCLEYLPGWPRERSLEEALGESAGRELKLAATQHGPHRADLRLTVGLGTAAETLSRGQGKLLASAMRLAQAQLTERLTGRKSVLLIDDLGAELDRTHSHRFFESLAEMSVQVLATSLEPFDISEFGTDRTTFHVEHGRVVPGSA